MKKSKQILCMCLALILTITLVPTFHLGTSASGTSLISNSSFEYDGGWNTGSIYRTTDKTHISCNCTF